MSVDARGTQVDSTTFVRALARGLTIIRVFDADHSELTLAEVARRAEIPPAAARRFLSTLQTLGYVRQSDRTFALTPKILELGYSYLSSSTLPELVQPYLQELSRTVGQTVSAAVLMGSEIVYVVRIPSQRIMDVAITIGTRLPAAATGMGRVLLSGLPDEDVTALLGDSVAEDPELFDCLAEIREQGWAMVESELESGLCVLAAPIKDKDDRVIAAIGISSGIIHNPDEETVETHLPLLLQTATAITDDLRLR